MIEFRPIEDRVIVEPIPMEEKTKGGIYVPETVKEKPNKGVVVAIGPGKKDDPTSLKPGDKILYGKYAGVEINEDGRDLLIMREKDVFTTI